MKAQTSTVFIFILIALVIGLMFLISFKGIAAIFSTSDDVSLVKLTNKIFEDVDSVRRLRGTSEVFSYNVPSKIEQVCFITSCSDCSFYRNLVPYALQAYEGESPNKNLFLLGKGGFVLEAFDLGSVKIGNFTSINDDNYTCYETKYGKIEVKMEGLGDATKIQPLTR